MKYTYFINIWIISRLDWAGVQLEKKDRMGKGNYSCQINSLLPAWTWPDSLSQPSCDTQFKSLQGLCIPGSPTIHLIWKLPQKTYNAVWLNFTMPSWGLGFFVVFVSIQWSSIASLEMTVGGNAIFHYTKYK